jgi:hypothetical protein
LWLFLTSHTSFVLSLKSVGLIGSEKISVNYKQKLPIFLSDQDEMRNVEDLTKIMSAKFGSVVSEEMTKLYDINDNG